MARRIVAGAVLAAVCIFLAVPAASAGTGEKHVVTVVESEGDAEVTLVIEKDDGAWLGVGIQDLDKELRQARGLDEGATGVLVNEVYDDSPAEKAGLKCGDIIVAVDGKETKDVSALVKLIRSKDPETEVEVAVVRDGRKLTVNAVLGQRSKDLIWLDKDLFEEGFLEGLKGLEALGHVYIPQIAIGISGWGGRGRLGVYVDDLSEGLAEYFEVPDGGGVLVEGIVDDSPADEAGIKAGDIILKIGDDRVADTDELIDAISDMKTDVATPIVVIRKGREVTLTATVGESYEDKIAKTYKIRAGGPARREIYIEGFSEEEMEELKDELEELRDELLELKEELKDLKD